MKFSSALISGFAGSAVLTIMHQVFRNTVSNPPRMDKLGEQAVQKMIGVTNQAPPPKYKLFGVTMAGDITGNAMYYSMVGSAPFNPIVTGSALGLAAGLGAVLMPERLGLDKKYSNGSRKTQILTIAIYLAGGVVAGLVQQKISKKKL
jgi:hypothetical protein